VTSIGRDVYRAARSLARSPVFAATTALTLAIGIGTNAAVFGLVNAVLLHHAPYDDPARLVMVWQALPAVGDGRLGASPPEYVDYATRNRVFSGVGGYSGLDAALTGGAMGEPENVSLARTTASLFPVLGVQPAFGRLFTAADDREGSAHVAILSWGFWQRRFGGDRAVLGRVVRLDDQPYTIVGVMPRGFEFPWRGLPLSSRADLWIPMAFSTAELAARAESYDTRVVARLRPGVTMRQANADVVRIAREMRREHPDVYQGNTHTVASAELLERDATAAARPVLVTLSVCVVLVMLIACANAINLLVARAIVRQQEMAVRRAMGAGVSHIVRHALAETLVLALIAGGGGALLAWGLVAVVRNAGPDQIAGLTTATLDGRVMAFTLLVSLGAALICGIAPALRWSRQEPQLALRHTGRSSASRERHRLQRALIVFEATSAMTLIVGAGLLVRSLIQVLTVPAGFDPSGVAIVRTSFSASRLRDPVRRHDAERAILERLRALPGIPSVALTSHVPLADERSIGFVVDGGDPNEYHFAANALVDENYFHTMRIPIVEGRGFESTDSPDSPGVTVINRTMAARYWPERDPIGRAIVWGGRRLTIVGIADDVRLTALDAPVPPTIYNPIFQTESGATRFAVFVVRFANPDAAPSWLSMRAQIHAVDPDLPVFGEMMLRDVISDSLAARRFLVELLGGFAGVALLLAVIGLYGVLSYVVASRTSEFGIRLALGAQRAGVHRMVVGSGLRLVATGVALGTITSAFGARTVGSLLYGVSAHDPIVYAVAAASLLGVSLVASYLPGRRAARLDPMSALRGE